MFRKDILKVFWILRIFYKEYFEMYFGDSKIFRKKNVNLDVFWEGNVFRKD